MLRWQILTDYLVLAAAFYALLRWAEQARALRIALSIVGLHAAALVARHFSLVITSWVLEGCAVVTVVLLLLAFQPELRRAFMRLDTLVRSLPRPAVRLGAAERAISTAAFRLAGDGLGALIVIVRGDSVSELVEGGVSLEAEVSPKLLEAIFQKGSPLHDGAAIVSGSRIVSANTVLPLTQRRDVPDFYGTRHRAAMGLAERCDADVIVVSEERGEVTLMERRGALHVKSPDELMEALQQLQSRRPVSVKARLRGLFLSHLSLKFAALGLAAVVWSASFLAAGNNLRTVSVPVEFSDVPSGMDVTEQSASTLEVQLRGSTWLMDSVSLTNLIANFSLRNTRAGWNTLSIGPGTLGLPPGIVLERVSPQKLVVRVVRRQTS